MNKAIKYLTIVYSIILSCELSRSAEPAKSESCIISSNNEEFYTQQLESFLTEAFKQHEDLQELHNYLTLNMKEIASELIELNIKNIYNPYQFLSNLIGGSFKTLEQYGAFEEEDARCSLLDDILRSHPDYQGDNRANFQRHPRRLFDLREKLAHYSHQLLDQARNL